MTNESNPYQQPAPHADHDRSTAPEQKPISPRHALMGVAVVLIVAAVAGGLGHSQPLSCR